MFANHIKEKDRLQLYISQCSLFLVEMLSSFPSGYDVPVLSQYLDWIAVMTYDYHGQWDKKTGHVSPMYGHPGDDNPAFNTVYISVFIN